jgi:putative transposase
VKRLMGLMGLEAIHPGPRTTVRNPDHKVYPYLLRGVTIERRDQVWSSDITYIPMHQGFM